MLTDWTNISVSASSGETKEMRWSRSTGAKQQAGFPWNRVQWHLHALHVLKGISKHVTGCR